MDSSERDGLQYVIARQIGLELGSAILIHKVSAARGAGLMRWVLYWSEDLTNTITPPEQPPRVDAAGIEYEK